MATGDWVRVHKLFNLGMIGVQSFCERPLYLPGTETHQHATFSLAEAKDLYMALGDQIMIAEQRQREKKGK